MKSNVISQVGVTLLFTLHLVCQVGDVPPKPLLKTPCTATRRADEPPHAATHRLSPRRVGGYGHWWASHTACGVPLLPHGTRHLTLKSRPKNTALSRPQRFSSRRISGARTAENVFGLRRKSAPKPPVMLPSRRSFLKKFKVKCRTLNVVFTPCFREP